jgi:hypothetical protein
VDTGTIVVTGTCPEAEPIGVIVWVPVFDSTFTVLSCCWVHPEQRTSTAMSMLVRMNNRKDDIGITVDRERK